MNNVLLCFFHILIPALSFLFPQHPVTGLVISAFAPLLPQNHRAKFHQCPHSKFPASANLVVAIGFHLKSLALDEKHRLCGSQGLLPLIVPNTSTTVIFCLSQHKTKQNKTANMYVEFGKQASPHLVQHGGIGQKPWVGARFN